MGKRIRVIIVDSRPQNEGRQMLQKLLRHGIPCTYTHLNALSYVMEEATKVRLPACLPCFYCAMAFHAHVHLTL